MNQKSWVWNGTLMLLAVVLGSAAALASMDDFEPPPGGDAVNNNNGNFNVQEAQFDQWIYQGSGNPDAGRARINAHLKLKIDELVRVCALTEVQRHKLALAGRGDVKRFNDQVEEVRKKFLLVKNDQQKFNQIWQDINPLQQKLAAGLFGENSMFAKTVQKTLSEEQQAGFRRIDEEHRRFRYEAIILSALISFETTVGFRGNQHDELTKLLLTETKPPRAFGQYDSYFVMYSLSKLPAAKLKALLDDRQWKLLQQQLNQGRAMEQTLAQMGLIDAPKGKAAVRGGAGGFFGQLFGGGPVAMEAFAVDAVAVDVAVGEAIAVEAVANEPVAVAVAVDNVVVEHGAVNQSNGPADALKPENGRRKMKR